MSKVRYLDVKEDIYDDEFFYGSDINHTVKPELDEYIRGFDN